MCYYIEEWTTVQVGPHSLFSVLKENRNAQLVLETAIVHKNFPIARRAPGMYRGQQGSVACSRKMLGRSEMLAVVRKVYGVAAVHYITLVFI